MPVRCASTPSLVEEAALLAGEKFERDRLGH
jgi:hypothetical protein